MNIDITQIVVTIIGVIFTLITTYAIPYIKSKTTNAQWENITTWAKAGVQCAEIVYKTVAKSGSLKFDYVKEYIEKLCKQYHISIDEKTIKVAIENAWKELGLDVDDKVVEEAPKA